MMPRTSEKGSRPKAAIAAARRGNNQKRGGAAVDSDSSAQNLRLALGSAGLVTVAEAAMELRMSQRSIRRWIAEGRVEVIRFGRTVRIHRAELQRLKEQGIDG